METSQSVAEDHDKVERVSHKNGIVEDVAEEDRRKFRHGGRRVFCFPPMAYDSQSAHLLNHFRVHHLSTACVD